MEYGKALEFTGSFPFTIFHLQFRPAFFSGLIESPFSMLPLTDAVSIPESELEERFVRSSGPGGQNVNKVATAVQLRFDAAHSSVLSDDVRARLRKIAGTRMTDEGVLVIDARRHRTQAQNREDARERLAALVCEALVPPRRRRKTRPTHASKEKRIASKKLRAETKRSRGRISDS